MGNGWVLSRAESPYYNAYGQEGEEISSTTEGRHVLVTEEELIHPLHADPDDLVRKGDPVCFMDGVGVALKTATSLTEAVPIDTEGIWRLAVVNSGDIFGPIYVGQTLFIDFDGLVTDDWTFGGAIFGYALQSIADPNDGPVTEIIAVKVHWGGPWWLWWWWFDGN